MRCLIFRFWLLLCTMLTIVSCRIKEPKKITVQEPIPVATVKPGSSYRDTLVIKGRAALFYEPDSLQYEKIRAVTEPGVFESTMHEYEYQFRNAKRFLKASWPQLPVTDIKNTRFLRFQTAVKDSFFVIDLDSRDPCGLYVFDGRKAPAQLDMMNVETQVAHYFSGTE